MSTNINTVIEKLELAVAEINRGQLASQNRADYGRLLSGAHAAEREIKGALDRLQAQQSNAEPVAWAYFGDFPDGKRLISADNTNLWGSDGIPLYTHPPASTEPRLTVEQAMEVVEPFIDAEAEMEDGARWNWESKHKKYREMIEEIRDRLTKAAKP